MNSAVSPNNNRSDLLFVHDAANQRKWLIDGGAVLSIMPPTMAQRLKGPTEAQLQAANGTRIQCYGVSLETISLTDRQIQFPITIADVNKCSDRGKEVYLPALLGYYDSQIDRDQLNRPTNPHTDQPTDEPPVIGG